MRTFLRQAGLTIFSFFIYQFSVHATTYPINVTLSGTQEVPVNSSAATATFLGTYNDATDSLIYTIVFSGLTTNVTAAHFHAAPPGLSAGVLIGRPRFPTGVTSGSFTDTLVLTASQEDSLKKGLFYFNVHTITFPGGEIRAQIFLQDPTFVAPDIICPTNISVNAATGTCSASVSFAADTNTTVPISTLYYRIGATVITSPRNFSVGTYTVVAIALNARGFDTCSFTISVKDVQPPTIICPANITRPNDPGLCGAVVNFQATATDLCSRVVTITYSKNPGTFFPVGTTVVTATATDSSGNSSNCSFNVVVNDVEPPVIHDLKVNPSIIWAPNHKLKNVTVSYTSTDNCPGPISCVLTVTSNEAGNGLGDGNQSPDWIVVNDHLVKVRAERSGTNKNGRTYSIVVACTDQYGNTGKDTATVWVPHHAYPGLVRGLIASGNFSNGNGHGPHSNNPVILDENDLNNVTLIQAYPNPSTNYFTFKVETTNTADKVLIRLIDINGRVVEVRNGYAGNQVIRMGENLKAGLYVAEIRQGTSSKQIKIIKQ